MYIDKLCATCDSESMEMCLLIRRCPFWTDSPDADAEGMRRTIRKLHEMTGVGTHDCRKAIDYCRTHPDCTPMGYLKAKAFAVATPKLTFYERVKLFSDNMEGK